MANALLTPRGGDPNLVESEAGFAAAIDQLKQGNGEIAIDAERASGYRYSQRAYLIQVFRKGGGLHLIDPIPLTESKIWQEFNKSFSNLEWVIHASTQDLPCLIGVGLKPQSLFDTELAARVAGCERVGLAPLAESLLDLTLTKEHSAVDWSIRPLKSEWLNYAALDVDILLDIKEKVEALLVEQSKLSWAKEEFAAILQSYENYIFTDEPKADRWRRTSGMHKVKDRQTLTIVRELWVSRNELARQLDLAPSRVLTDEAIIDLAIAKPDDLELIAKIIGYRSKLDAPPFGSWHRVIKSALAISTADQPELRIASAALPPIRVWRDKNPLAFARLSHAKFQISVKASELKMPSENLITPELVRRVCWGPPPANPSEYEKFVGDELTRLGARRWQILQVAKSIASALGEVEPLPAVEPVDEESNADGVKQVDGQVKG